MLLDIISYNKPVLREKCIEIDKDYPNLSELIDNMHETVKYSGGVGIAAPQVGIPIRLFIADGKVFINSKIIKYSENKVPFTEGCLSIPSLFGSVLRPDTIVMNYFDENFAEHTKTFKDFLSRVIQHEYDHIEGKLFIDYLEKNDSITSILKDIENGVIKTKVPETF
jgi:peptide deformylase